jgi:hypothetical protein
LCEPFLKRGIAIFLRRIWPIGFLAVLAVFYFGDIRGSLFIERDLLFYFIPPRQFWVEEVKNFVFPLWNPYYFNGHPLFATLQPGVIYPFSVLYLFLPFNWAFNLNIELHFALSGIFTYLLLRGMKASQGAAVISAVAFMLSGYLISVHNLLSTLLSVTWVPLFYLCYFSAIKNNRISHAVFSGVVGTLMFLGGGVEVCYLTFGAAFFLTLFPELVLGQNSLIQTRRRLFFFATCCVVFFGLSAIQLLPFLEVSQLSIRSEGLSYKEAGTWSLHPFDLIEFFLPDQYGLATDIKEYWAYQNWLKTIYMGGIPYILAAFFLKKWDRRAQGFLLLFFISLGLAMGNNTLFHHFLYDYLPFFHKLRYPVKFIFLAILILSIAAGLGYDYFKKELAEKNLEGQRWVRNILSLGFFCMIAFGILNLFNEPVTAYLKAIGWDYPDYNETEINIFNFKRFLGLTSLFCLGLFLYSKPKFQKPFTLAALITLLVLDLFFAHFNFYNKDSFEKIQKRGENANFVMSDPGLFRVFVNSETRTAESLIKADQNKLDANKEKLVLGLLGNQRILHVGGWEVTKQRRWENLMSLIDKSSGPGSIKSPDIINFKYVESVPASDSNNLLNMMNVKYVVSVAPITSSDFKLVQANGRIPQEPQEREEFEKYAIAKVYENKKVLPHTFLVPKCKVINSDSEYQETLKSENFDPEKVVLLDAEPKDFSCNEVRDPQKQEPVQIDSYKSNTVDLTVNSKNRQFLFLSDSYYPGWKSYVDGKEVEIFRANYLFRAIIIEAGEHQVRFKYDPLSFKLGLAISLTTVLSFGVYALWGRRKMKKMSPLSP